MSFDVWRTLFSGDFDTGKYLYHYTNIDCAIKIICQNTLLFSKISKTNDTSEAKTKITFTANNIKDNDLYIKMMKSIIKYFNQYRDIVQLLCFSEDIKLKEQDKAKALHKMDNKDKYYDVSGRGFALPRMWAQYANNNQGVCFVINKDKVLQKINRMIAFSKSESVMYKNFYDSYLINENKMKYLYDKISMISNGSLTLINMIQEEKKFLNYNFFEKLKDWSNEHEYRILALIDSQNGKNERLAVSNISCCIEGVVLGEKIDLDYEEVIRMLLVKKRVKCDVKKIEFVNQRYVLK